MAQSTQAAYRKPRAAGPAILIQQEGLYANSDTRQFSLGQIGYDIEGNQYRYVKANEALTRGLVVTDVALAAWDTTVVTDGAVTAGDTLIHIDTNTSAYTADQYSGYWIGQAPAATNKGALHKIKSHPAIDASSEMDVFLDESTPAAEAIADGTALLIYHPWLVEKIDGTAEIPRGVVVNTIDSGYYGWIQTGGFCPSVAVGHSSSAAVVVNEPLAPVGSGKEGYMQGVDFGTPSEAEVLQACICRIIALEAVGTNTVCMLPAYIVGEL